MKKVFLFLLIIISNFSFSQVKFNHLGLGFNYNGTGQPPSGIVQSMYDESANYESFPDGYGNINRLFSSYEFGLQPANYDFVFFDFDLLQGVDYIYSSNYSNSTSNDTSINRSINLDMTSSLIGIKSMARITTPYKKRFFYNFGIGVEGLVAYNVDASGSARVSKNHWMSGFWDEEVVNLNSSSIDNYYNVGLVQQVGLSYRLGEDEKSFPLNQSYLELDFQIINNFSNINEEWFKYRNYGLTLSVIYEVK